MRSASFFRILILCGTAICLISACSQGTLRFIEIPSQSGTISPELFQRVRSEIPAAGYKSVGADCSEQDLSVARYATKSPNFHVVLVLNKQTGVVALQITEMGVSSFSSGAEQEYQLLLSHLRTRLDNIREHISEQDVPAFIKRLYSGQRLTTCV